MICLLLAERKVVQKTLMNLTSMMITPIRNPNKTHPLVSPRLKNSSKTTKKSKIRAII
jgi:hypothetical protein